MSLQIFVTLLTSLYFVKLRKIILQNLLILQSYQELRDLPHFLQL